MNFEISSELKKDQKLFRYINIKQFLSMIESESSYLTKVIEWEDVWEAPLKRIPIDSDMEAEEISYFSYDHIYGQCWSTHGDSDALWRIYSPNRDGIMIQTTVEKLSKAFDIEWGLLAPVIYYENLYDGLEEVWDKHYEDDFGVALLKRRAFNHEEEVRLLAIFPYNGIQNERFIQLPLIPNQLIENIILDPRCEEWYLQTMINYCKRASLKAIPYKSDLYKDNIYEKNKIKITIREIPNEEPYFR